MDGDDHQPRIGKKILSSSFIGSPEQIVTVPVAYLRMVREELPGGHSPAAVGMGGFLVPALGAIREQEGEVERHGTGVEVRHTLEASSPDLDHQIMGVAVGQDTDLG